MEVFGLATELTPLSAVISDNDVSESAKFHLTIKQSSEFLDQWDSPCIVQIIVDFFMVVKTRFSSIKIQKHDQGFQIDYFHSEEKGSPKLHDVTGPLFDIILLAASIKKDLALATEPKLLALMRVRMIWYNLRIVMHGKILEI